MIYLDNAATTMIKPAAVGYAVQRAMRSMASPGRGGHSAAMLAAQTVYDCRMAAARLFSLPEPERVVFTMNATHALNIAINTLTRSGSKVVVSGFEHNSVTRPLHHAGAEVVTAGSVLFDADETLNAFDSALKGAQLAVCTHVSNAFGYILPIYEIARLCESRNVPLIVDASQSAGVLELDWGLLSAAYVAMPGHKGLFGPQGTGILLCGQNGTPLMCGGSGSDSLPQHMPDYLPDRLEAGTHNVCGIAGLLEGIKYVEARSTAEIFRYEHGLLSLMLSELQKLDGLELFQRGGSRQSGVVSLRSDRTDCDTIAQELDRRGVCVRSGLHCAPFAHRSVGTLETGTVRFSFSPFVSERDVLLACGALEEILQEAG